MAASNYLIGSYLFWNEETSLLYIHVCKKIKKNLTSDKTFCRRSRRCENVDATFIHCVQRINEVNNNIDLPKEKLQLRRKGPPYDTHI